MSDWLKFLSGDLMNFLDEAMELLESAVNARDGNFDIDDWQRRTYILLQESGWLDPKDVPLHNRIER